jgi:hypothetical protein
VLRGDGRTRSDGVSEAAARSKWSAKALLQN